MSLLIVENLSKSFKDFKAVQNLNFTVNSGDVYGFLGPNGAGKSTTLRMILGLIYPSSGKITFNGKEITPNSRAYLKDIGALIERPDFFENLSALNNLKIFAKLSEISNPTERIQEVLEEVKLWERRNSKVKSYSQGMKQRLGIAQAILHKPKLIILDEPSNGLDPQGQADMRNLILKISKEMNITVIISSHILSEIELICNRMIIINNGEKLKEGNVKEIMEAEQIKVEIKTGDIEKTISIVQSMNLNFEQKPNSIILKIHEDLIPELNKKLYENKIELYELKQLRTLEQYFLNITQ